MEKENFNFWQPEKENNSLKDSDSYLQWAFSDIASMPRESVEQIVKNLLNIGYSYHAARCLEISSQYKIGVFFTGNELISYRLPNFGDFHRDIRALVYAGLIYLSSNRISTAKLSFQRALNFVEEALRQINSYESESTKDLLCLAIGFELAGHCSSCTSNKNGLDYYEASEEYWKKAEYIDPEEIQSWKNLKIMKTILDCLNDVSQIKDIESDEKKYLLSLDYSQRINKSKELFY
ncbi:MAG: hypothetical protein U0457_05620 [Candidatus Sericytochromatia bacterium]